MIVAGAIALWTPAARPAMDYRATTLWNWLVMIICLGAYWDTIKRVMISSMSTFLVSLFHFKSRRCVPSMRSSSPVGVIDGGRADMTATAPGATCAKTWTSTSTYLTLN